MSRSIQVQEWRWIFKTVVPCRRVIEDKCVVYWSYTRDLQEVSRLPFIYKKEIVVYEVDVSLTRWFRTLKPFWTYCVLYFIHVETPLKYSYYIFFFHSWIESSCVNYVTRKQGRNKRAKRITYISYKWSNPSYYIKFNKDINIKSEVVKIDKIDSHNV